MYLHSVEASVAATATTEDINANIDVMQATKFTGKLLWLLQVRLFPPVVQKYTIADVEEQPSVQNKLT